MSRVKAVRHVAKMNTGFEEQLRHYGAFGCDIYAAHQHLMRTRLANLTALRLADPIKLKLAPWPCSAIRLTRPYSAAVQVQFALFRVFAVLYR